MFRSKLLYFLVLVTAAVAAPAGNTSSITSFVASTTDSIPSSQGASSVSSAPNESETVPPASDDPNFPLWSQDTQEDVEPIRNGTGATQIVPDDIQLDRQNPDLFAPPSTDEGTM